MVLYVQHFSLVNYERILVTLNPNGDGLAFQIRNADIINNGLQV